MTFRPSAMSEASLRVVVRRAFGVELAGLVHVRSGEDVAATVHRGTGDDGRQWAVRCSRTPDVSGLQVAAHLTTIGVTGVPGPMTSRAGAPFARVGDLVVSVAPWVSGSSGAEGMSRRAWRAYGRLLAAVHGTAPPDGLRDLLPVEQHEAPLLDLLADVDARVTSAARGDRGAIPSDAIGRRLAVAWTRSAAGIRTVGAAAGRLADDLSERPRVDVLCHADAHAHNVVVSDDEVTLLDWGGAVLAPRERDLMFVLGGGVLAAAPVRPDESAAFLEGYGPVDPDVDRLAYYLCSWAVQDLADYAARALDATAPAAERAHALARFEPLLSPSGILAVARAALRRSSISTGR